MSSDLPQYQRLPENDNQDLPPWKKSDHSLILDAGDEEAAVPAYPPRFGESSGNAGANANVTYIFVPRWPVKGKQDSILGVIKSKEETTEMVQRAFPILAGYPPGRVEFLAPQTPETKLDDVNGWSRIMEEAWSGFRADSPGRLKVQVADGPGDLEDREKREKWQVAAVISAICSPLIVGLPIFIFLGLTGRLD